LTTPCIDQEQIRRAARGAFVFDWDSIPRISNNSNQ